MLTQEGRCEVGSRLENESKNKAVKKAVRLLRKTLLPRKQNLSFIKSCWAIGTVKTS